MAAHYCLSRSRSHSKSALAPVVVSRQNRRIMIAEAGLDEYIDPIAAGEIIIKAVVERLKRQHVDPSKLFQMRVYCN